MSNATDREHCIGDTRGRDRCVFGVEAPSHHHRNNSNGESSYLFLETRLERFRVPRCGYVRGWLRVRRGADCGVAEAGACELAQREGRTPCSRGPKMADIG